MRLGTIIFIIYMEGKKDYIPLSLSLCSLSIFIIYFLVRVNVFLSIVQVMSSPILPYVKHDSRITTICTWFFKNISNKVFEKKIWLVPQQHPWTWTHPWLSKDIMIEWTIYIRYHQGVWFVLTPCDITSHGCD